MGAGATALLVGLACLSLLTRALIRVGWPPEGFKALAYLWVFALWGVLPASLGLNLLRPVVPWRLFVGWWLIALGLIHLAGVLLIAPELRNYQLDVRLPAAVAVPLLALTSGGVFLLLRKPRPSDGH